MGLKDVIIKKNYDNIKCPYCGKKLTYWNKFMIIPEYFKCEKCMVMFGFTANITISDLKEFETGKI